MAEYLIQGESLIAIADEVRELSGVTGNMSLNAMKTNLGEANDEVSEQTDLIAQIVSALDNKAVSDGNNGGDIGSIIDGSFSGAYNNSRINMVRSGAFWECSNLTSINLPACSMIDENAFCNCTNLETVNLSSTEYMGYRAFMNCYSLTSAIFPNVSIVGQEAFNCCENLKDIVFTNAKNIRMGAFGDCYSLTSVTFPNVNGIGDRAFEYCENLTKFILPSTSMAKLDNIDAFEGTPMSTDGYFYVHPSLVVNYKTATNWVYFSSRFRAIENSSGEAE